MGGLSVEWINYVCHPEFKLTIIKEEEACCEGVVIRKHVWN